jgi:hypothetical protein
MILMGSGPNQMFPFRLKRDEEKCSGSEKESGNVLSLRTGEQSLFFMEKILKYQ